MVSLFFSKKMNLPFFVTFFAIFDGGIQETRKKRLEEFLSLCMKQKVKILRVLPSESQRLTEEGSLLVMDILVQQSTAEFRQYPEDYLHYFEITVQTGGKYHKKVCCKLAFVCISTFL